LLDWPIALKTSQSIWPYPVFAFIRYVSIHLDISATVLQSAPEKLLAVCALEVEGREVTLLVSFVVAMVLIG
jgi:hypothetical protein